MTNVELLKQKIEASGYRLRFLAQKLSLSYQGFFNKMNGVHEFRSSEIAELRQILSLTPEETCAIFFGPEVGKTPTSEVEK